MAVTKAEILESIMERTGFTRKKSTEITETLLEIIKRTLAQARMFLSAASESSA